MTPVIAQRDLVLVITGRRRQVRVRVGRPVQDVETVSGVDWRCPITVSGVGRTRFNRGLGVDSLQALVDAIKALEVEIEALEASTSGHVEWLGGQWHGVPSIQLAYPRPKKRRPKHSRQRKGHKKPAD